ncbi:hypothetical protein [Planctomycetes bacterium CA13]|uniref:hypothetical protein n=1 Tax=Novipirellula herctigrandis TaxID=2527986 RepID=UPI0011B4B4AC
MAHLLDQCGLHPERGFAYHELLPAAVLLELQAATAYQVDSSAFVQLGDFDLCRSHRRQTVGHVLANVATN